MKKKDTEVVRMFIGLSVKGRRGRGRQKKKLLKAIECDMRAAGMSVNDVGDWDKWKLKTKVADPK